MIAPNSASYPVRGAALEAGLDYALALAFVDAPATRAVLEARRAILCSVGSVGYCAFFDRIEAAWLAGHLRVRRWSPQTDGWRPQ